MQKQLSKLWKKHKAALLATVGILLLYLLLFAMGISCPIKFFSGISCPGCGMTRACIHALRLDFSAAFSYHPLWIALPFVAALLILFKIKNQKKAFYTVLYTAAAVMIAVYLFRLLFTKSNVVVFLPEEGLIPRCIKGLITYFTSK